MAIKKLQNNYTTPDQSKRLLELGVPRWSADEYRDRKGHRYSLEGILDVELFFQNFPECLPCWSVGRLIEIIIKCEFVDVIYVRKRNFNKNTMDKLIEVVERCVKADFDFSKLEE